MYNELIVMTFDRAEDALKVRHALEMMRDSHTFGLMDAVIITRDTSGQAAVHQQRVFPTEMSSPSNRFAGLFADVLFGQLPEEMAQQLADAGLDKIFLQDIVAALGSDSSAILIYIPQDKLIDAQRLMNSLSLLRGTVHHTTISSSIEEVILKKAG